jgi:hypothetical protein
MIKAGNFVQESYDENNSFAIEILSKHLISKGYSIEEKLKEDFDVDIIAFKDGKKKLFEVEVKTGYSFTDRESFKFNTVSFLSRKEKWNHGNGFLYVIICKETDWALVAHSSDIFLEEYKEKITIDTKHRKGYDYFYRVPKQKCKFFKIK